MSVTLLVAILSYNLAQAKRDDDLFEIRYKWFDKCVDFSGLIAGIMVRQTQDSPNEAKLTNEILNINNDIQRHLVKGGLIFPVDKMKILKEGFRGDIRFYLHHG